MTRWIIFTVVVACGTVPALAHTPFSTEFRKRFIQAPDGALVKFYGSVENSKKFTSWAKSTPKMGGCKICHGTKKTERNSFGQAISDRLRRNLADPDKGIAAFRDVQESEQNKWIKDSVKRSSPDYEATLSAFKKSLDKVLDLPSERDRDNRPVPDAQTFADRIRAGLHPAPEVEKVRKKKK
jgi:hypothetical protein